ncbi:MAG: aldo/keto reductase [Nanoarchaeota archaeon]|nr:MAG: aldo/keto reductase [Nanoarchaeota archaeon]
MDLSTTVTLNNGIKIPILGFGTWQITGETCEKAVLNALKLGYRHIDTARIYNNEKEVGRAIKKSKIPREEIFVTTKLWNTDHDNIEGALEASLKKLGTGYVDLYLMHYPVKEVRNRSWMAMEKLLDHGMTKSIGVSNFTIRHLKELIEKTKSVPSVNQVEFNPYLCQKELLEFCRKNKIQLEAYCPLVRGRKMNDPRLIEIAEKYNKTQSQILIRWGVQHEVVAIPKATSEEHIKENADVFDFEISPGDMKILNSFNEDFRVCWDPTGEP